MSITAIAMRRRDYTWAEIAEHLMFSAPADARWSALRVAEVRGQDVVSLDWPDDGG